MWVTYKNLALWFDNWEQDIVDLGFAHINPDTQKVVIPKDQLRRIVNIDETCLSLDGSKNVMGGWPEVTLYDPRLPRVGQATSKSALTLTMITGSNAFGEAIVPHLQFQTKAKTAATARLTYDVLYYVHRVFGQFGKKKECSWSVTFGLHQK